MTVYMRCGACSGGGKVMGGGMIMATCDDCDGKGRKPVIFDPISYLMSEVSKDDAQKPVLTDAPKKRGRPFKIKEQSDE